MLFLRGCQLLQVRFGVFGAYDIEHQKYHQAHELSYNMVPEVERTTYTLYYDKLHEQLQRFAAQSSFVHARIHQKQSRVTIIYTTQGLLTFDL